jgi:copper(I)-binding protein
VTVRSSQARRFRGRLLLLLVGTILALGAASCSSGSSGQPSLTITVTAAWVQVAGGVDLPVAGYFTINNEGAVADDLISASSPVAESVELHQTTPDMSGMVGMDSVAQVDCPPGVALQFAPGGYHLMLSGLTRQLKAGDRVELDLVFARAGMVVIQADVRQV